MASHDHTCIWLLLNWMIVLWQSIYDWTFLSIKDHLISKYKHSFFRVLWWQWHNDIIFTISNVFIATIVFIIILFIIIIMIIINFLIRFFTSSSNISTIKSIISFIFIDITDIISFKWKTCIIRTLSLLLLLLLSLLLSVILLAVLLVSVILLFHFYYYYNNNYFYSKRFKF